MERQLWSYQAASDMQSICMHLCKLVCVYICLTRLPIRYLARPHDSLSKCYCCKAGIEQGTRNMKLGRETEKETGRVGAQS